MTDETFTEMVGESDGIYVVDFWAPWCGPCKMVAPVLDELAEEYGDRVQFGKVNVDECPQVAQYFGIRSIPTIGLFRDGETLGAIVGAQPKPAIKNVIDQALDEDGGT